MAISSPNRIIWQYFQCLQRAINRIKNITAEEEKKQDIALCIFLGVTIVEAFFNIYFRIIVEEEPFTKHKNQILEDLEKRKSLDHKIRNWPKIIFRKGLNFEKGISKAFLEFKNLRNELMHFKNTYESVNFSKVSMHGLANTSVLDDLFIDDAVLSHELAEGMLTEVFRLRGITEEKIPGAIHLWTGRIIS